jgi:predicted transglutaminase-like cysteine proteinase
MNALPALCAIAILSASLCAPSPLIPMKASSPDGFTPYRRCRTSRSATTPSPSPISRSKLERINPEINAYQYNSAFHAYWETPSEFRQLGGQCRDYAVAEYARLYDLGVADADMELTAVRIRRTGELHAVLVVKHQGRIYVLDNLNQPQPNNLPKSWPI